MLNRRHSDQLAIGRWGYGTILALVMCLVCPTCQSPADDLTRLTLQIQTAAGKYVGRLATWNDHEFIMLRRDGRMLRFGINEVVDFNQKAPNFTPYDSGKIHRHLQKMFGSGYEVSRTAHYVVVHPPGQRQRWADPFEKLYQRFWHYFTIRGYSQRLPEFPMVVVVFRSRSEFNAVADVDGMNDPNAYVGYYSPRSNWVVTYQQSNRGSTAHWESDNVTLIHEAFHQYAFNVGIHSRWAPTPKWCAEGLASMFEARGVNHSRKYPAAPERLHPKHVRLLRNGLLDRDAKGWMRTVVATDRAFQEDISSAYASAWGLTYYLAETRPADFNAYLQRISRREALKPYLATDRLADFVQYFGSDFGMLEANLKRFLERQR